MDSVLVGMEHGIREKRESNMRGTIAGLLILGLVGSPLAAQVAPAPKPPAAPPVATQPNQPPKPGATPPVKKEPQGKVDRDLIPITSTLPALTRLDFEALIGNETIFLEIRDISVKEFFERIKVLNFFSTLVIKDNLGDEMMPHTVVRARDLSNFILQLGQFTDSIEVVRSSNSDESIIVVSAKPKPAGKPNILFVPVNLEPLLAGIRDATIQEKKFMGIEKAIAQGVELDMEVRGLKPTVALKLMMHRETSLLFVAGPTEQVEVAIKILSALGARIPLQDTMGGGWRTVPDGSGMGGSLGMGGPEGGMAPGAMIPGVSGGSGPGPASSKPYSVPLLPKPSLPNPGGEGLGGGELPSLPGLPEPGASVPRSNGLPAGR